jgi:hypothetical protein
LILELWDTKSDETWTQGSPQHKEQVFKKGFFSNSKIFLPILDELKNLGFWERGEIYEIEGARTMDSLQD